MPMRTMLAEARRIIRFGMVGVGATLTHIAVANTVLALVTGSPYAASAMGFTVAFAVSYLGHYHFTFAKNSGHGQSLPRFFVVALTGFLGSLIVLKVIATQGVIPQAVSLTLSILVIPGLTYLAARIWAFR
ncbi:MAG: GtrA family protein [Alphaproteobacteria bacterium]